METYNTSMVTIAKDEYCELVRKATFLEIVLNAKFEYSSDIEKFIENIRTTVYGE